MAKLLSWMMGVLLVAVLSLAAVSPAAAQQAGPKAAPTVSVSERALPPPDITNFDPDKATKAYLSRISGEARAKSDSYFEGGYVLIFVDAFVAILISAILLFTRLSARIRNFAQGVTRSRFFQVPIYVIPYLVITTLLALPLSIYEGYFREHAYGLSNQNFVEWLTEFGIDSAVGLVAAVILVTLLYVAIRRARQFWWMWAAGITVAFMVIGMVIAPVYIAPLTNHYKPLREGPVKEHILSLARSEGIPVNNVYEFDASKQSKRISANVSGMFGTIRISMNDNLMNRSSEREIMAVLGHEMGHYVLDHGTRLILMFGLVIFAAFGFTAWGFNAVARVFGGIWDVRGADDPAGMPALFALFTFFMLLMTPVTNTISRTTEAQADIFGVNASRQPDGFAEAALQLSEYRKLEPGPWEEFIFFDHPSGRARISMMMHWKAEHLNDPDIKAGPVSPQ